MADADWRPYGGRRLRVRRRLHRLLALVGPDPHPAPRVVAYRGPVRRHQREALRQRHAGRDRYQTHATFNHGSALTCGLVATGSCPGDPSARLALNKNPQNHLRIGARGSYSCAADDPSNCTPSNPSSQFRGDIDEVVLFSADAPTLSLSDADIDYRAQLPRPHQPLLAPAADTLLNVPVYSGAYRGGGGH